MGDGTQLTGKHADAYHMRHMTDSAKILGQPWSAFGVTLEVQSIRYHSTIYRLRQNEQSEEALFWCIAKFVMQMIINGLR